MGRKLDKNKALFKLKNFPKVLWINLDRYQNRKEYMEGQLAYWGIEDHVRIVGIDGKEDDPTSYLKGTIPHNMNNGEIACVLTHLNAIKYFVEETDLDEVIIMEDDVDLSPIKHWNFTWKDVRSRIFFITKFELKFIDIR